MKCISAFCVLLLTAALSYAQSVTAVPAPITNSLYASSMTYTMASASKSVIVDGLTVVPARPASFVLTFKVPTTNVFEVAYARSGYTNIIATMTYTAKTAAWYMDNDLNLITGDVLLFTKTAGATAQLTINWREATSR